MVRSRGEGGAEVGGVMAKVYVSSTIADLRRERQAVLEWLLRARHQAVDSYLPDSETVRDSCLNDLDDCDVYVLILGHRYGFQPPEDNPEGLSITQLEFRRAGHAGVPRIALLRASIPDVHLSDMADPGRLQLVLAFRTEVAREVQIAEFRDLQGLIQGAEHRHPDRSGEAGQAARRPPGREPGAASSTTATLLGWAGGAAGGTGRPVDRR
jgi:hypothetical protein